MSTSKDTDLAFDPLTAALDFGKAIMSPISTVVENWQKRQTDSTDAAIALNKAALDAKVRLLQTAQDGDIAWENTALQTSGWKSGYLTIVLSIPLILCFVPGMDYYIKAGFDALELTPSWYQYAIGVMISADFGYKKFADFMALKKGA